MSLMTNLDIIHDIQLPYHLQLLEYLASVKNNLKH